MLHVPFVRQKADHLCGPAVLQMVYRYFGRSVTQRRFERILKTSKRFGTSRSELIRVARADGFSVYASHRVNLRKIDAFLKKKLPVIVNYVEPSDEEGHYAVAIGVTKTAVILNDPWNGRSFSMPRREFLKRWRGATPAGTRYGRWIMVLSRDTSITQ